MKKLVILAVIAASSFAMAATMVEGDSAKALYNLMPVRAVEVTHPRLMNLKTLHKDFNCVERVEQNGFSYKCRLPTRNSANKIMLDNETSWAMLRGLVTKSNVRQEIDNLNENIWPITCTVKIDSKHNFVASCEIDL